MMNKTIIIQYIKYWRKNLARYDKRSGRGLTQKIPQLYYNLYKDHWNYLCHISYFYPTSPNAKKEKYKEKKKE